MTTFYEYLCSFDNFKDEFEEVIDRIEQSISYKFIGASDDLFDVHLDWLDNSKKLLSSLSRSNRPLNYAKLGGVMAFSYLTHSKHVKFEFYETKQDTAVNHILSAVNEPSGMLSILFGSHIGMELAKFDGHLESHKEMTYDLRSLKLVLSHLHQNPKQIEELVTNLVFNALKKG